MLLFERNLKFCRDFVVGGERLGNESCSWRHSGAWRFVTAGGSAEVRSIDSRNADFTFLSTDDSWKEYYLAIVPINGGEE